MKRIINKQGKFNKRDQYRVFLRIKLQSLYLKLISKMGKVYQIVIELKNYKNYFWFLLN